MMFSVDERFSGQQLAGLGENGDSGEPGIGDQIETQVKESAIREILKFFGSLFNFGPKTIGYLQEDEIEKILNNPKIFRYGFMAPGCGVQIPLTPCPGSFWSNAPYRAEDQNFWAQTFPFGWRDFPIIGDWFYKKFGARWSALEPGLSHLTGWFWFDPKTLNPVDLEGIQLAQGNLGQSSRYRSLDELLQGGVDQGIAATKEGVLAKFRENILKNWTHRDNPANETNTVINDDTGEVINANTGEVIIPNFVDTAMDIGGVGGVALFGVGAFIFFKSLGSVR